MYPSVAKALPDNVGYVILSNCEHGSWIITVDWYINFGQSVF
jgi:hypothetical protein